MTSVFDLHDQACLVWRDARVREAVLVHVDAHHDAAAHPAWQPMDIGNYVRVAIRERIVTAVHWVVPDPMWSHPPTRRVLLQDVVEIADGRPAIGADGVRASVEGTALWMGPLGELHLDAPGVLLDIDVDYLLTARYDRHRTAEPLPVPWCTPGELVARLGTAGVTPLMTTVASSVTGGFTQLRWAHLAREIAARLDNVSEAPFLRCCALLLDAARLRNGGDAARAVDQCGAAVAACPAEPAAHFHLAEMLQAAGRLDDARTAYATARALDPFYAHPFRSRGAYLYRKHRLADAEAAYLDALALDADDGHALLGLAMVMVRRGRAEEARDLANRSLAAQPGAVDAWRTLAEALTRLGDLPGAIAAYERALLLSLRGAPPLRGPWCTNPERRLVDPRHWHDHNMLGRLLAARGDLDAARAHYRIAASGAPDAPELRTGAARLEARRGVGRGFRGVLPS